MPDFTSNICYPLIHKVKYFFVTLFFYISKYFWHISCIDKIHTMTQCVKTKPGSQKRFHSVKKLNSVKKSSSIKKSHLIKKSDSKEKSNSQKIYKITN